MILIKRLFPGNFFEIITCVSLLGLSFLKFSPFFLIVLFLGLCYQIWKKRNWRPPAFPQFEILAIGLPFWLLILGLLNTTHFQQAFEDMGRLLPYALLPLFLSFVPTDIWKTLRVKWLTFFVLGLLLHFIVNLWVAAFAYMADHQWHHFFYTYLDRDTNILSVTISIATLIIMEWGSVYNKKLSTSQSVLLAVLLVLLSMYLLMLQSRIVVAVFILAVPISAWIQRKNNWHFHLVPILTIGLLLLFAPFRGRFQGVITESSAIQKEPASALPTNVATDTLSMDCMGSSQLRLNALRGTTALIWQHPVFGVGSGDWRHELTKWYHRNNYPCNAKEQSAPHNQYARIALKHGTFGLLSFLLVLIFGWLSFFKHKNPGQFAFLFITSFASLGYDLLDVGTAAPVMAFLATIFFFKVTKQK
jgi:O-antigen ligase